MHAFLQVVDDLYETACRHDDKVICSPCTSSQKNDMCIAMDGVTCNHWLCCLTTHNAVTVQHAANVRVASATTKACQVFLSCFVNV
jgi:hypothetical protein